MSVITHALVLAQTLHFCSCICLYTAWWDVWWDAGISVTENEATVYYVHACENVHPCPDNHNHLF